MSTLHATGLVIDQNDLTIAATGTENLKRGNLVIRGVGAAPSDYFRLRDYVISGFSTFAWTGFGINSSDAATDPNFVTAVGVLDNANFLLATFQTSTGLVGDETLAKWTYYGDANLDGKVDDDDQSLLDLGRGSVINEWWAGDFNYLGLVDDDDQSLLDFGRANQVYGVLASQGGGGGGFGVVPEPGVLGLLSFGAIALLRRRQKQGGRN